MKEHRNEILAFLLALALAFSFTKYVSKDEKESLKKVGQISTMRSNNGRPMPEGGRGIVDLWKYKSNNKTCMILLSVISGMPSQTIMECD